RVRRGAPGRSVRGAARSRIPRFASRALYAAGVGWLRQSGTIAWEIAGPLPPEPAQNPDRSDPDWAEMPLAGRACLARRGRLEGFAFPMPSVRKDGLDVGIAGRPAQLRSCAARIGDESCRVPSAAGPIDGGDLASRHLSRCIDDLLHR